jgi:hypothetical protein
MDEILKESLNTLRAHFHPEWADRTPFDAFTRLLAKNIRHPDWQPTDHEFVTPDQITSRREWWTIEELAKLTRGHGRDKADHEKEPIVLAVYGGRQRLLDGNTRINMWVKRKDANKHQVNVHVIETAR